jgi:hypothetical protein
MQIVHTDNRLITADCDSNKRQTRPLVRESAPYLSDRNKDLVLSPTWVIYTKRDWPTDPRSQHNFDFDLTTRQSVRLTDRLSVAM